VIYHKYIEPKDYDDDDDHKYMALKLSMERSGNKVEHCNELRVLCNCTGTVKCQVL